MADNNQNWRNQSQQSGHDWDQNRNRYNQENESRNRENSDELDQQPISEGSLSAATDRACRRPEVPRHRRGERYKRLL